MILLSHCSLCFLNVLFPGGGGCSDGSEPAFYTEEIDMKVELNPQTGEYELVTVPHLLSYDQGFFHVVHATELVLLDPSFTAFCYIHFPLHIKSFLTHAHVYSYEKSIQTKCCV